MPIFFLVRNVMKQHQKSSSDGISKRTSKYPFDGLPVDASVHIDSFSDAKSKLRTALTSADSLRVAKNRPPVGGQLCVLVFKLLSRWKPSVREWEGRPSRSPVQPAACRSVPEGRWSSSSGCGLHEGWLPHAFPRIPSYSLAFPRLPSYAFVFFRIPSYSSVFPHSSYSFVFLRMPSLVFLRML